jgi:hypothetical protein
VEPAVRRLLGLHPERLLARPALPRLDLRAVSQPQLPEPVWAAELVWLAALAAASARVQPRLVVLVAAAVVRPAPWSWARTLRPSSSRWRACAEGSRVS